ncbi:MAG TPA: response regulator transcription factor [Alphaproteobacteria bacterium]|nr:response regulator transcription factor [Alphaproteobacteria bacterium]
MRLLLADDHPLFADALRTLVAREFPAAELQVAGDIAAAQEALARAPFDLAILDLHMPGSSGFDGLERTLQRFPGTPVVVISGLARGADVARAIELGARGFLPKTLPAEVLAAALRLVLSGGTYVPADYAQPSLASPAAAEPPGGALTPREVDVLRRLVTGKSNKEIGRELNLQEITVKLHVRNVFRKLGVRNRVEATNAAARLGYGPGSP